MLTPIQPYTIQLHKERLNSLMAAPEVIADVLYAEEFPLLLQDNGIQYQLRVDFPDYTAIGTSHMLERFQLENINYRCAKLCRNMANGIQQKTIAIYTDIAADKYKGADIIRYVSQCQSNSLSLARQQLSEYMQNDRTIATDINEKATLVREHIKTNGMHSNDIPIYSLCEDMLAEITAWDFCNPADPRRPGIICKDGKLYEQFENVTAEERYVYAVVSYFTGIGILFSEKAYNSLGKSIDGLSSVYIEVSPDEKKLWSYNLHMVLSILRKIET